MENSEQVVSCSGMDCEVCSLIEMLSNLYNNFILVSLAFATLSLVIAGFYFILSRGKGVSSAKAKLAIKSILLGFAFVLSGWLIIHTIIGLSGVENAGGWWSFECVKENSAKEKVLKAAPLKSFASLAEFIASEEEEAFIKNSIKDFDPTEDLKNLMDGEGITFSAPAKMNSSVAGVDGMEAFVPFLTVDKEGENLKIGEETVDNLAGLQEILGGENNQAISLMSLSGNNFSKDTLNQMSQTIEKEIGSLLNSINTGTGQSTGTSSLLGNNQDISELSELFSILNKQDNATMNKIVDTMINSVVKSISNEVEGFKAEKVLNGNFKEAVEEIQRVSGDRSDIGLSDYFPQNDNVSVDGTSYVSNKNANASTIDDKDVPYVPTQNKNTNKNTNVNTNKNTNKNSNTNTNKSWVQNWNSNSTNPTNNNNSNSPSGEDFSGWKDDKDNDYSGNKNDNFNCNYKPEDDNITMALKRIECRDPLRYEMLHRFVKTIKNTDFEGGMCAGCGAIEVNFDKLPLKILDQVIVHEATHSAHFCIGMSEPIAEVERIACGNQMGSLDRQDCDKHGDEKKNFMMREFDRQGKEVMYKGIPVRGYLARWQNKVSPIGDLSASAFDWPIKYALSYGDSTYGPYHYGDHEEQKNLGLKKNEEDIVEKIMEDRRACFAKAKEGLPKAGECEKTGGGPIQIDYSK